MELPLEWLAAYVEPPPLDDLLARLTALGHMVDGPLRAAPGGPVIPLEIRQNRPDCLSVLGIAREVAAAYGRELREPELAELPALGGGRWAGDGGLETVDGGQRTAEGEGEDRLCLLALRGVRLERTPAEVARRLEAYGQRLVSPLVDLGNYVMLELGQPLHIYSAGAVDLATMQVRPGRAGESLELIEGGPAALGPGDLLVADRRGPLALAGVMGGRASAVAPGATEVVVEAGTFRPHLVRRTARRHGLLSEAALRSSKLLPPALALVALGRLLALLRAHGAAEAVELRCSHPRPAPAAPIRLAHAEIGRLGGLELRPAEAAGALARLGCAVALEEGGATIAAAPPWWRSDLGHPVDLVEEVLRVAGYERIAPASLAALPPAEPAATAWGQEEQLRGLLAAWGYDEAILDSFLAEPPPALAARPDLVRVANPPAGSDALRPDLLPNLLGAARHLPLHTPRRQLCEIGRVFRQEGGAVVEERSAAWLALRPDRPADGGAADYYALKAEALAALAALGLAVAAEETGGLPFPYLSGRGVRLRGPGGQTLGYAGLIDARAYGLTAAQSAVGAEIRLPEPAAGELWAGRPRRESERVDLSYTLGQGVGPAELGAALGATLGAALIDLRLIDTYGGAGAAPRSATYRAVYLAELGPPRAVWERVREQVEARLAVRARG